MTPVLALAIALAFPPAPTADNSTWDALAECESGGNWSLDGTFDGGLQFAPSTWNAMGGQDFATYAYQASREQQIVVAERLLAVSGWGAWPACSAQLGLSGGGGAPAPEPSGGGSDGSSDGSSGSDDGSSDSTSPPTTQTEQLDTVTGAPVDVTAQPGQIPPTL